MAMKSLDEALERLARSQSGNETARAELGQLLAELPVSQHGRFVYHSQDDPDGYHDWGVEVYWHTPGNVVYSAHNLVEHKCDESCDTSQPCDREWDEVPLDDRALVSAVLLAMRERIREIERENQRFCLAIRAFSKKRIGYKELMEVNDDREEVSV